jgi:hypothetical protein
MAANIFDLMEAEDWNEVRILTASTSWTPKDLEKKHGVRINERFLTLIIQLTFDTIDNILLYLQISGLRGPYFHLHFHLFIT